MKRIGIYSGTFDPVHKGHIAFALEAVKAANLDEVFFAPEIKPRRKPHVSHFAHRLKMAELAIRGLPKLKVLELPDANFSAKRTMPRLKAKFKNDQIVLLIGSDLFEFMGSWPGVKNMLADIELVVAARNKADIKSVEGHIDRLPQRPKDIIVLASPLPDISSSLVRRELESSKLSQFTLPSVADYAKAKWLYDKVPK